MAKYQLPPLKNETEFEEFVCDVFNEIEKTGSYVSYQTFGVKGQNQKGIDILSSKTKTVIQCKLKDLRATTNTIRKSLLKDIEEDLKKAERLNFKINRFIFTSTHKDDAVLQEFATSFVEEDLGYDVLYLGWDTLSKYAQESELIMKKYFPKLRAKKPKTKTPELPENALGRDLLKKNYIRYLIKRYGDWKQIELNRKEKKFNWGSFQKSIMKRYRADGINHIHIGHFEEMISYLQERIDKTIMGKVNLSKGKRNYSDFHEHTEGIID